MRAGVESTPQAREWHELSLCCWKHGFSPDLMLIRSGRVCEAPPAGWRRAWGLCGAPQCSRALFSPTDESTEVRGGLWFPGGKHRATGLQVTLSTPAF